MDEPESGLRSDGAPSSRGGADRPHAAAKVRRSPRKLTIPRTQARRATYAVLAVVAILAIGTVGLRFLAGSGWIDSFYFECMLATGEGPPFALTTASAKLFASLMAFLSVASVISAIFFTLGPILIALWRETLEYVEEEAHRLGDDVRSLEHRR